MEIPNIANKGNVDRGSDPAQRADLRRSSDDAPAVQDHATISAASRDTLAAVEVLAERARRQGGDRQEIVDAARAKVVAGELAAPEALTRTAQRLLDSGFLAG